MSRRFPDAVSNVGNHLARVAGSYLHSVTTDDWASCKVCALPINPAYLPPHVVVIDDSWVSGASAQSVAVALKQAGVEQVSILSVARVLSPHWAPNLPFLRSALPQLPYDWTICPWTLGDCPWERLQNTR